MKEIISILEKWSGKYKRSIDCNNPKGFSQKAHCAGRRKRKRGGKTKSRPVESFVQEIDMSDLKKFVVNEIQENLQRELGKRKIKESSKTLFEAVSLQSKLKNENADPKKIKLANKAVSIAENKLREDYDEYDDCDCGEGEGQMLKAQLLSIMNNAQKLYHMIDEDDQFEDWIQSKITIAEDYLRASYGYLTYFNGEGEGEFGDDEWEGGEDDWDEVEQDEYDYDEDGESFEDDGMDVGQPSHPQPNYMDALSPDIDDDEIFERKLKK